MHIDAISLEPNSSYQAEGRFNMGSGASMTSFQIKIETDEVGRIRSFSDGTFTEKDMADTWDYQQICNVKTGVIWDLRLHTAAWNGTTWLAEKALAEGADVDLRIKQGATPLHWAAAKGREELAKLLLDHGADVNAIDELGWTPRALATSHGFNSLVKLLIERGATSNATVDGKEMPLPTAGDHDAELIEAAEAGDFDAAKAAIDAGADLNCKFSDGWTPLLAASKDHPNIVELLLANGADPNIASNRGYTPLMRATGNGEPGIVRLLLESGADKRMVDCDGKTAFQLSLEMHELRCAQLVK